MSLTGLPRRAGPPSPHVGLRGISTELPGTPSCRDAANEQEGSTDPRTSYLCSRFVLLLPLPARLALGGKPRSQQLVWGRAVGGVGRLSTLPSFSRRPWGPAASQGRLGRQSLGAGERPRPRASLRSPAWLSLGASLCSRFETPRAQVSALPGIESLLLSASASKMRPVMSASQ